MNLDTAIEAGPLWKRRSNCRDESRSLGHLPNYIACLNEQDWPKLGQFVDDDAIHNGRRIGLSGYCNMLERDFDDIPDLCFDVRILICDPPYLASRIHFDCTPKGKFLGLPVNGRRVCFTENVFYEFHFTKIAQVWSVIDQAAIEAQLR